jgi:Ca-activated chloride channel family protein
MTLLPAAGLARRILVKLLPVAVALAAANGRAAADESIRVSITSPAGDQAVFGDLQFEVTVHAAEPIVRVDFFVDKILRATDDTPPYRVQVDTGQGNAQKSFTAVAHGLSGETGTATVATPKIPVDLEMDLALQQLYVTVTRDDSAVLDLERTAFRILDSGLEQQLVTFERGDAPFTVVLLLDASESMKGERLEAALGAARRFLAALTPLDEAMVLVFSDRALYMTGFQQGSTALDRPTRIAAGGGTALNDHLYVALRLLDRRLGRPVVLLLSDGADTLSFLAIDEVRWKLRRGNAVLYRIRPVASGAEPTAFATSWRTFQQNRGEVDGLERALFESGGRVHLVPEERLDEAILAIIEELRQQYVLGYYPSTRQRDGGWRPVLVEVDAPGVTVRTRSGYVDQQDR